MGMFDSLYIELDGREQELQSKRFDCVLNHYRLGDWIVGSLPGVRVYFDRLWLDGGGKPVYRADDDCARKTTVFVVLAQGVFVDYQIHEGELAAEAIEPVLRELRERWSDSARLQGFLVETLRTRQQRIASLEHRLGRVQSILASARRLKAGESLDGIFGLLHEEDKKLAAGEDPLDVIAWTLSDDALGEFPDGRLYVALDTAMLWNVFCVVQVSLVWRGRSVPVAWKVLRHSSASVAFKDYRGALGFAARLLKGREVALLADRGFIHAELLRWVKKTPGWHFRIRCKRDAGLFLGNGKRLALRLSAGELRFYAGVFLGAARVPVELAVGWERGAKEPWIVAADEAAGVETLRDYGLRFCVEEGFLDHKSGGFQWESSRLRDAGALQRLCLVMAAATLFLVCQGASAVASGRRREVDPHWRRGISYARIGWNWARRALARGWDLLKKLALPTARDPEPCRASRKQPDRSRWMDDMPCRYLFLFAVPSMG